MAEPHQQHAGNEPLPGLRAKCQQPLGGEHEPRRQTRIHTNESSCSFVVPLRLKSVAQLYMSTRPSTPFHSILWVRIVRVH